jgi:hypothetical protein
MEGKNEAGIKGRKSGDLDGQKLTMTSNVSVSLNYSNSDARSSGRSSVESSKISLDLQVCQETDFKYQKLYFFIYLRLGSLGPANHV